MGTRTPDLKNSRFKDRIEKNKKFEDRLNKLFIQVIKLCKTVPISPLTSRMISQLTASAGSISANFAEGTEAMSKKDFIKSIKIARKEAKETRIWL